MNLFSLALCACLTQAPSPAPHQKSQLDRVQGTWTGHIVWEFLAARATMIVEEDHVSVSFGDEGESKIVGRLRIGNPEKGAFDLLDPREQGGDAQSPERFGSMLGLHKLRGDSLTIWLSDPGEPRPPTGDKATLIVYLNRKRSR